MVDKAKHNIHTGNAALVVKPDPYRTPTPAAQMILNWREEFINVRHPEKTTKNLSQEASDLLSSLGVPLRNGQKFGAYYSSRHPRNLSQEACEKIASSFKRSPEETAELWQLVQRELLEFNSEQDMASKDAPIARAKITEWTAASHHNNLNAALDAIKHRLGVKHIGNIRFNKLLDGDISFYRSNESTPYSSAIRAIPLVEKELGLDYDQKTEFRNLLQQLYPRVDITTVIKEVDMPIPTRDTSYTCDNKIPYAGK